MLPGEDFAITSDDGSFVYTPPTGFTGVREFGYSATDGMGGVSDVTTITLTVAPPVLLDEPGLPTQPDGDPTDGGAVPTVLASTGSTTGYALGTLAALLAATGFVLVRSSRRVA
jgi:hypothetical protein